MGRGGNRGGRGRGRGSFGGGRGRGRGGGARQDNRTNKADVDRHNETFERYYNGLNLVPDNEREAFWQAMRRDLPNSFRFTGSKAHALAVQQRLKEFYIPEITSITYEGQFVEAPKPVVWYPDQLAWFMTTPKSVVRRFPPFASFQKFLVAETDVGNISRQEVVSMIPPLVMDLKPGMTVLDLCAAPGSKSAQLIEMLHAGEEERAREVAQALANGLDRPSGDEYMDDGRSTGLLIANDVDYKRAHMLVHQMKRLSSPNIIVTNHDATIFPSIKLPSAPSPEGKPSPNRYLKFDRILADVPCSGDGTSRKNLEIWSKWTPSNGLGLHLTQVRILVRALQMLKVGGRVVYSTCSMNPVEDEAVLGAAIDRCGGPELVSILETKDYLPGLKRYPGLKQWTVMDKTGRVWNTYKDVTDHKTAHGEEGLSRLQEGMFPPTFDLPLERCMRVYPHQQDTGAFFIAILEKKTEIKARSEEKPTNIGLAAKTEGADLNGISHEIETTKKSENVTIGEVGPVQNGESSSTNQGSSKRKLQDDEPAQDPVKRVRSEPESEGKSPDEEDTEIRTAPGLLTVRAPGGSDLASTPFSDAKYTKQRNQPFEEPFKYLDCGLAELEQISKFYNISPRFPRDRFMVRNAQSTATKNIYYTTSLARDILQENEGKGMKFVHSGIKIFVKQDAPKPEVCPWRIQTDGLAILEAWVGPERAIKLTKRETLRKLLIEMFPRFDGDGMQNLGEIGDQIKEIEMGCCVLIVEPTEDVDGLKERMVFPLWKSFQSLNLMLPKEDRKAMLLRLFNDDTPLVNLTLKQSSGQAKTDAPMGGMARQENNAARDPAPAEAEDGRERQRNSSSPEPEGDPGMTE